MNDPNFPIGPPFIKVNNESIPRKTGSTNKGHIKFCQYSVAHSNSHWRKIVTQSFHSLPNFEAFYSKYRMVPFPLPPRILKKLDHFPGSDIISSKKSNLGLSMFKKSSHSQILEHDNLSNTKTGSDIEENEYDLFLNDTNAMILEIAKRYPNSYTARKEAPSQGYSDKDQENLHKPNKKKTSRFNILRSLGFKSNESYEETASKSKNKRIPLNTCDSIDSDDSDENIYDEDIQEKLYQSATKKKKIR